MLTFQQIGDEAASQLQDTSTATRLIIDRAINQGMQLFGAILNREWRVREKTFSIEGDQQWYQMPEDCIKPKTIVITIGGIDYPLDEISDPDTWNIMNRDRATERSDFPRFYHIKGADQFGIFPIPSSDVANGGTIRYEPRMRRLVASDYITGSVALTNDSAAVVGTGTTFTAKMVGRTLLVEDEADLDGIGYTIDSFTDATHITLENFYMGNSGTGLSYRIGVVPHLPDEFHESLVDYACYRGYKRRRDRALARDSKDAFDQAIILCRDSYSSMSSSQYSRTRRHRVGGPLFAYDHSLDRNVT